MPYAYLLGFLDFLSRNRRHIHTITYRSLDWGGDYDPETMYQVEWQRWAEQHQRYRRWRVGKIHVLIQQDVDSIPENSLRFARDQLARRLASVYMIFGKRIDRALLRETGKISETVYPLDDEFLKEFQRSGGEIGYHSNAYERSGYDFKRAESIVLEDIAALRTRFDGINVLSPHGGVPCPQGLNNYSVPALGECQREQGIRWVHNKRSLRFNGYYSDGSLNSAKRKPDSLDLKAFVKTWVPGRRYRVLLHPQYYGVIGKPDNFFSASENLQGVDWYERATQSYSKEWPRAGIFGGRVDPVWGKLRFSRRKRGIIE